MENCLPLMLPLSYHKIICSNYCSLVIHTDVFLVCPLVEVQHISLPQLLPLNILVSSLQLKITSLYMKTRLLPFNILWLLQVRN